MTGGSTNESLSIEIDKKILLIDLLSRVRSDLASLVRTQNDTHDAATHEENRAEHAKDTRATEQSYLARGLADRVEALRQSERRLSGLELREYQESDPIGLTALVRIGDGQVQDAQTWWVVPLVGGLVIGSAEQPVRTITPAAPLGRALMGQCVGDEGVYDTPRGPRGFSVLAIR